MSTLSSGPDTTNPLHHDIERLGPWFHNLHLPDGTQTYPNHWLGDFPSYKWAQIEAHIPRDLHGWTCLDIGCNAGFYTFELAKRGGTVMGIDLDERYLRQAQWAAQHFGLTQQVDFRQMQVYDLARLDRKFDLVLFMGVFYHLRYPMLALDIVSQKVNRLMIFQTLEMSGQEVYRDTWGKGMLDRPMLHERGWPKMAFFEHGFAGDPTNWWAPNHAGSEAMLRSSGMRILSQPGHEIYLCEPNHQTTWIRERCDQELRSALGG